MGILKQGFRGIKKAFDEGTAGISSADVLATALIAKDKFVGQGSTIEKITSRTKNVVKDVLTVLLNVLLSALLTRELNSFFL